MKIGILTLPLHTNYGGNLQAYALMTYLKDMGHEVWIIDRRWSKSLIPLWKLPFAIIKRSIRKYLLNKKDEIVFREKKWNDEYKALSIHTQKFIDKHIQPQTTTFHTKKAISKGIDFYNFDAIIVGSDQVWRPGYTPNIENYFLDFVNNKNVKKISFAASFGTDVMEFTEVQQKKCARLLRQFDAVSVRETSGVNLCLEYFNVKATHVLDPTMLLPNSKYLDLLTDYTNSSRKSGGLLVYILDETADKLNLIKKISSELALSTFKVNSKTEDSSAPLSQRIAPPTEEWIKGFYDADFVITDSFHACVFSILFHKPFVVYGNKGRGVARFISLLEMFNLMDRLVYSLDDLRDSTFKKGINWEEVDGILELERKKSHEFITTSLL
ncbi:polysaccharide pyruvyl transferase family protein [Emticicia sp. 21SJ11W-3]|uniref:polysaccharide pyruvyl transferase family protein n=1 Tax=Emticicia sp. 21SJ11W-3 TaxID=2916755 RepID=UPI00209DB231|nr:polysaccharide pyruvyl transferase family protein [Emticicia sp. 21SJ11W-3]UTA68666.1 polysaccharide pyruvyl transferase family protein [Emticicia sp. 21SJ11W-3]